MRRHNAGYSKATKYGVLWGLLFTETFFSRAEAVRKERFLRHRPQARRSLMQHNHKERSPWREVAGSNPFAPIFRASKRAGARLTSMYLVPLQRLRLVFGIAVLCAYASAVHGQDAPLPVASPEDPTQQPTATPAPATPAPTIPPPQLIPPDILPMPDQSVLPSATPAGPTLQQLDEALKPKPLSEATENYRRHIEWRKLRNRTQNDPEVKAALAVAEKTRTDLQKRKLMARYYEVFYARAAALGPPDFKAYLMDRKREALNALPQPRVRPTSTALVKPKSLPQPVADTAVSAAPSASQTPTPVKAP